MTSTVPPRLVLSSLDATTLSAAVAAARSWRQVLLTLGLASSRHVRQLRVMCEEWDLPHAHLERRAPPDDLLRTVLATASGWPEVLSRLGYTADSGSARSTVRTHAARLGLDLQRLTSRPRPDETALRVLPELSHLRHAGAYLVAAAFVLAGHQVSWPLEPAAYDLVVDTGDRLLRVQVKTTSRWVGGSWVCSITRSEYADVAGGKRRVRYEPDGVDVFGIVDGVGRVHVIPMGDVAGLTTLALRRYADYRVPQLAGSSEGVESG